MARASDLADVPVRLNRTGQSSADDGSQLAVVLRTRASVPSSGRSRLRLLETSAWIESRRARHRSDWWIVAVPPLALLHLALFLTLRHRPGRIALVLWRWVSVRFSHV